MIDLIEQTAIALAKSVHAIVLTGAGMSTESGIPDYRGKDGLWTKNPALERELFRSYSRLIDDPRQYWEHLDRPENVLGMSTDLSHHEPNAGHYALAELEERGLIKCVITQNVDGLHEKAGSHNLVEFHGSLYKLRCMSCGVRLGTDECDLDDLRARGQLPPRCRVCGGVLKPDVVFFNEPIPADVIERSMLETSSCDLMLICGTSAEVIPFAELPRIARDRGRVTIIEINKEPTLLTRAGVSDYLLQGNTGEILPRLLREVQN